MKQQCNLNRADRVARTVAGVLATAAGIFLVRGVWGVFLVLAGALLVFSGAVGFCHVYKVLGLSTVKKP